MRFVLAVVVAFAAHAVHAQAIKLPGASRTVFKCTVAGKVIYSDDPCPGAERIDVEPTRGVSKSTGKERVGRDVRREHQSEQMAEVFRPLTGMDAKELDTRGRRMKLPPGVASECYALDRKIAETEAIERTASGNAYVTSQRDLLPLRERYRSAGC